MSHATARSFHRALGGLSATCQGASAHECSAAAGFLLSHKREYAAPEHYGRPSHYTQGTDFLGTPPDHLDRVEKRPVSPHVFEIGNKGFHYRMPLNAISSITNRATGVALSVGFTAAGCIAIAGDLPGTIDAFRASYPALIFPTKVLIAGPLVYHYLGGLRHILWDKSRLGNQADKDSYMDLPAVDLSSKIMFGATAVGTLGLAAYSI